ncbi:DUF6538 domain-containing protein [Shewanella indica]|uniref:DUF6538 domain-containing protein n=1 Tax=Shewanella indica TaxID=768528 RepID=UPI000C31FFE0|nr:DUF6538 domain-containing protein [Shewanella indica]
MAFMIQPKPDPKTGVYKVRKVIPVELRPFLEGKSELKRSLNTKDAKEAKQRASAVVAEFEALVAMARIRLANQEQECTISNSDLDAIVSRWATYEASRLHQPEILARYIRETDEGVEYNHDLFEELEEAALSNYYGHDREAVEKKFVEHMASFIDEALMLSGLSLSAFKPRFYLAKALAKQCKTLCSSAFDREGVARRDAIRGLPYRGPFTQTYAVSNQSTLLKGIHQELADMGFTVLSDANESYRAQVDSPEGAISNQSTLRQLFEWVNTQKGMTFDGFKLHRWLQDRTQPCNRAVEFFGDKPIGSIGKLELRSFFTFIITCPVKPKADIRRLPFAEQAKAAKAQGLATITVATAKKELNLISGYFQEAVRLDVIPSNPCHGVSPKPQTKSSLRERGYSESEVARIFSLSMFRELEPKTLARYGAAPYWLPVLLAYTGARAEEIAQLYVRDIEQLEANNSFWYIHIRDAREGQSVKNNEARKVPICDALIELGFIRYVKSLPPNGRLFPLLKANAAGKLHNGVAVYLKRKFQEANIELFEELKPLHAFRHRFITQARQVMREDIQNAITGHSNAGNVGRRYGSYADLHTAINKMPRIAIPQMY